MFLFFVTAFGAVVRVAVGVVAEVHFVHGLEGLGEIVLQGRNRCTHRRAAEAMGDEVEVGQATLDARLQDRIGPRVPQGRSVLSQQVSELFADLFCGQEHVFSCHLLIGIGMLSVEKFCYCFGRKFSFAHVPKVPG